MQHKRFLCTRSRWDRRHQLPLKASSIPEYPCISPNFHFDPPSPQQCPPSIHYTACVAPCCGRQDSISERRFSFGVWRTSRWWCRCGKWSWIGICLGDSRCDSPCPGTSGGCAWPDWRTSSWNFEESCNWGRVSQRVRLLHSNASSSDDDAYSSSLASSPSGFSEGCIWSRLFPSRRRLLSRIFRRSYRTWCLRQSYCHWSWWPTLL